MIVWARLVWALLLAVSGSMSLLHPQHAPLLVGLALAGTMLPWSRAWRAADGTALRAALIWAGIAIALGMVAQVVAMAEPVVAGRPWTGRVTYIMVLVVLAALISVLGARNPGGGAWAILMALLVVVLLIPWLEAGSRVRRGDGGAALELQSPWTLFYGVLALAGVTNYLPTRYGLATAAVGGGLVLEYLGLTRPAWSHLARCQTWLAVAWALALAGWLASILAVRSSKGASDLERLWLWFRDHWGVVWALRIEERFNRSAELGRWPVRLGWYGRLPAAEGGAEHQAELPELDVAGQTLVSLLRRFVTPERMESLLAQSPGASSCESRPPARC